jgi:ABC-2 type transport system permease protein
VLAALVAASAVVAWRAEQAYEAERRRYTTAVGTHWDAQPDRHPHRVAHYGYLLFRPRPALGIVDAGVTAQTGSALFLEAHRQNSLNFAEAAQADSPLRFGALSMATVLQLLVPLVLMLAAAGSVAGERDAGTLAMVRAQGVAWPAVLGGKAAALTAAAVVLAIPAVAAAALLLSRQREVTWAADDWARSLALVAAHAAYFAICAALGVAVSALARSRRGATLAVVGLWIALWVVVPRLVPVLAAAAFELPTRATFEAEVERRVRALGDSHNPADESFAAFKQETLNRYGVSRVEDLPLNYNGVVMIEGERLTTEAYRGFREAIAGAVRGHARVAAAASAVSPFVAMRLASMARAGVDAEAVQHFEARAEDYRFQLVQHLNRLHAEAVRLDEDRYAADTGATEAPTRKRIAAEHWDEAPRFDYAPLTLAASAGAAWPALTALACWTAAAALALARLRPRTL